MITKGTEYKSVFSVTGAIYSGFIYLFKDNNPLHTDEEFARQKGFAGKVMHGNILNGFLSYFIGECLPFKNVIFHSQEIKYSRPVYLEDELTLTAVVDDYFESVKTIEFTYNFVNQNNLKVAKGKFSIGLI